MKNIAIFASGSGTNAAKIITRFHQHPQVRVGLVVTNRPNAGVIRIAEQHQLPLLILEKERFFSGDAYLPLLQELKIELIVLAGFLWKVPAALVKAYPQQIVNIHPALLPKYGGKGMYGRFVHEAVIAAGERESGITIHYVDEVYDNGKTILQVTCAVLPGDTPDSLAKRVQQLEHEYYPQVVEDLARSAHPAREG